MTVTLKFNRLEELAKFKSILQTNNLELNTFQVTLTCDCTEKEIQEAIIFCGATIIPTATPQTEKQSSQNIDS